MSELYAEIERLTRELDHFKNSGIIEVAVRNPNVSSYMDHWEGRATKAEAEVGRLRAALEQIADCPSTECARDPFLCKAWAREALGEPKP